MKNNRSDNEGSDVDWDKLGFGVVQTDYMYVMKCTRGDKFSCGEISRYGNIEMNPASGVLNYGQVSIYHKRSYDFPPLINIKYFTQYI